MAGCWKNSIVNCNVFPQASYVSCALFHTCFLKILKVYFSLIYKCCKPQRKSLKETLESPWTSTLKSSLKELKIQTLACWSPLFCLCCILTNTNILVMYQVTDALSMFCFLLFYGLLPILETIAFFKLLSLNMGKSQEIYTSCRLGTADLFPALHLFLFIWGY